MGQWKTGKTELRRTKWMQLLMDKFSAGIANAFIITGNIKDYAIADYLVKAYLKKILKETMEMEDVFIVSLTGVKTITSNSDYEHLTNLETVIEFVRSKRDKNYTIILDYPEYLIGTEERFMTDLNKKDVLLIEDLLSDGAFTASDHMLIFLTESKSNIATRFLGSNSKTEVINIGLPDEDDRLEFIKACSRVNPVRTELTKEMFAKLTAGLSLLNIEDIFLTARMTGLLKKELILDRKKELIQKEYQDIIEVMETDGLTLDHFAGHDLVKGYIKEAVINPIQNNDLSIVPKGILLMGPPGTGKTYFSRCLAGEAGMGFVEFKMSKILDKYVGEAEKNLERAMGVFRALAPVGVFIDEVDQALSRGENDGNSVSKNLFGMFLAEMSKPENRGKILWLGATNYPNKLDEAFKRAGRFDKKIPFFAPSESDRVEVFKIHLGKIKYPISKNIDYDLLSRKTDGYTQAEIENIVVKTLELAKRRKIEIIDQKLIVEALYFMKHAKNNRIKEMEDIAVDECNDLEFLPEKYKR